MKIKEILEINKEREIPFVLEIATIREVFEKMFKNPHTRLVYVVDSNGKCMGIISLGALIRHIFSFSYEPSVHSRFLIPMITSETARDIMNMGLIYATAEDEVEDVIKEMIKAAIKEIPILDKEKKIIGDVTILDLLKYENLTDAIK
jgi:CBS domain-containing protein